jgi:RNA-directed DNA polymerase
MNHSNKDGTSPAESGEGRPLIKKNAGQSNTYATQSGKCVSQGLAGVRKAARENKEMKFAARLTHTFAQDRCEGHGFGLIRLFFAPFDG